jgi:RimJ/RimL family protein N-acetyltransferase
LVAVGTQIGNLAAARLYEKLGFLLSGSSLTLRWAKEKR